MDRRGEIPSIPPKAHAPKYVVEYSSMPFVGGPRPCIFVAAIAYGGAHASRGSFPDKELQSVVEFK